MNKSLSQRTARRIMVRLARIKHQSLTAQQIYATAATFLSWDRELREAWICAYYRDLTKYLGFSEEDLAIVVANVV